MQDTIKIGAAALGGYLLGRTKKAKAAIGLALWLSGRGRPRDMAREQAAKALQSDRGQELLSQLRGPVLAAGRQAAVSVFESQAGRLSDALQRRTELVGDTAEGTGRRARGAARTGTDTVSRLTERRRGGSGLRDAAEEEPEYEDEYDEDEDDEDEEEDEDEEPEYEDEYDEADEGDEGDEEEEDEEDEEEEPGYEDEYDEDEDEAEVVEDEDEDEQDEDEDEEEEEEGVGEERGRRRGRRRARQPV
jgi:hypothetical protein